MSILPIIAITVISSTMNYVIKELQKLYEKTPVSDRFIRARILSGLKKSKTDLAKTQAEYEIFKKYKMRTAISN